MMEQLNIFNEKFYNLIKDGVSFVQLQNIAEEASPEKEEWTQYRNSGNLTCSYCRVEFTNSQQHRDHYKLDWHRYNLKQNLLAKPPVSEEEFNTRADDISSISGSDSSEEEDTLDTIATAQGKVFLKSNSGLIFSLYKCLIADKKVEIKDDQNLLSRLIGVNANLRWTVLMLGGGHFAGAIFNGAEPVLHKTFHSYTVRQGQGGSQSSRDNKNATSQPKSAGASLRRYNETTFLQHVTDIIDLWRPEMEKCHLILFRASGPYNRSVLFGGKSPILERNDPRLRTIPFSTRRATFKEVKRVHNFITNVYVYSTAEIASKKFASQKSPEQVKVKKPCAINRSKSRERSSRPDPFPVNEEISEESDTDEFCMQEIEINFQQALQSFDDSLTEEERKRTPPKKHRKQAKPKKAKNNDEVERKKAIFNLIKLGNVDEFKQLLENCNNDEDKSKLLNEIVDDKKNAPLHVAALYEQIPMLSYLLENDADLCAKNDKQFTPYTCMQSKDVRDALKNYAQKNPEKHNYNKAQIPVNLLTIEEQAERKRLQRKVKRDKEKEKKKEKELQKQEQIEKDRFLNLSDREKRALAAERRILKESGPIVLTRCFLCGTDTSGNVPFEYSGNRFCTMDCLKAHRLRNPGKF